MDALAYNRSQNLNPDDLVEIQRTVGARPDGIWGPKTVAKISAWQNARGREPDGRVDPATLAEFRALWNHDDDPTGDEALDDVAGGHLAAEPDLTTLVAADDGYLRLEDLQNNRAAALAAVQNDLFAFGFEPGLPDGQAGTKTHAALLEFQRVARRPGRIVGDARKDVEITFSGEATGLWDQPTLTELRRWKVSGFRWLAPGAEYVERRVKVANYGRLPRSSINLVDIPSVQAEPRRLHRLAAAALVRLIAAAETEEGLKLRIQSGWRAHRWKSKEEYEARVRAKYGSVARGRRYLAFDSPHETGLAVDFGTEGLAPVSSTIPTQRKTKASKWLVANAWRFGWHPYAAEPWHWEFPLSARAWTSGDSDWSPS